MNRKIAFRAWNANTKRMTDDFLLIPSRGVAIQWFDDGHTGVTLEHMPLMQFTGLLDKNGKEIYEGDIVNRKTPLENANGQVIWLDGAWKIEGNGSWELSIYTGRYGSNVIEIIGNIYENPKLLS